LWRTSIDLQAVDNLRVSDFHIETARKHIEGLISMGEVNQMPDEHYAKKTSNQEMIETLTCHVMVLQLYEKSE